VKGTPESGKIRLAESRKIAKPFNSILERVVRAFADPLAPGFQSFDNRAKQFTDFWRGRVPVSSYSRASTLLGARGTN
jgi:hypothetical protein